MTLQNAAEHGINYQEEFQVEEQHLDDVVALLNSDVKHREQRATRPLMGPDVKSADVVDAHQKAELEKIKAARQRPFFGRVDYTQDKGGVVSTIYIGSHGVNVQDVPHGLIVNRNAPIAELYYNPAAGSYTIPKGDTVRAPVSLKRMLMVEDAQLLDMDDSHRLPTGGGLPQLRPSGILTKSLAGASKSKLSSAVATLEAEQYKAVAAIQSPVLIVQGAAGSGKSLVALHRIDFILSPFSNTDALSKPTPERMIMFGPSPAFLDYVSGLLPELDVPRVRQTTVPDWILSKFSARVTQRAGDKVFDDLMNNRNKLSNDEVEALRFKGDLRMRRLLERYVRHLTREVRQRAMRFVTNLPPELKASKQSVRDAFSNYPEPNAARAYFVGALAAQWMSANRGSGLRNYELREEANRFVEKGLNFWPRIDFRAAYANLISDPIKILQHCNDGIGDSLAYQISVTAPSEAGRALGVTDLAPALYLDYAINGFESERFEHVVVDEAQDVSPLEIELMKLNSSNSSFTILGDLRQGILPHKSVENWLPIRNLFEQDIVSRQDMRMTYRSTKQITQYANRILQALPQRTKMPIAYPRSGERPRLVRSGSLPSMNQAIAETIQNLRLLEDVRSIGILTKWQSNAGKVKDYLVEQAIGDIGYLDKDGVLDTDITVSPIILTKGLEFDAVIVANASKRNFNDTDFDRMLLYLACTRARHYLEIHWFETRSPIVPSVERLVR